LEEGIMALRWSWSFGDEDLTALVTMGWITSNPASGWLNLTSDADKVYTYAGSPTRYGWIFDGYQLFVGEGFLEPPPAAVNGMGSGWIAAPWKSAVSTGYTSGRTVIKVTGASGEVIEIRTTTEFRRRFYGLAIRRAPLGYERCGHGGKLERPNLRGWVGGHRFEHRSRCG
jgi:hypothetical protein